MEEFEVTTGFYTIVPWLSGGFLLFGIVASIITAGLIGWYVGMRPKKDKKAKRWLAFGWILVFGLLTAGIFTSSVIYYESRDNLSKQITEKSGMEVYSFVRGDEHRFAGVKDDKVFRCRVAEQPVDITYKVNCR